MKNTGLIRIGVAGLVVAALGSSAAQSQLFVVCDVYRDSYADTDANACHGRGSGCVECTYIELKTDVGDATTNPLPPRATLAFSTSAFDQPQELGQAVSLAADTGLSSTPQRLSVCEGTSRYDRIRTARRDGVLPVAKDRSRNGLWKEVSAR